MNNYVNKNGLEENFLIIVCVHNKYLFLVIELASKLE